MATPSLDIAQQSQLIPPQQQTSQEHTADAPMQGTSQEPQNTGGITEEDQQRLIALARKYKDQWSQDRRILIERITTNFEFFKGNQNLVFAPGSTEFINTSNWMDSVSNNHAQDSDDGDLYQDCLNFYQMLNIGFVAALCPQVPKSKWMPGDADKPADVATAKAAQMVIDKIERDNKEASLLKTQLFFLYNSGSAFRFTRFVVSDEAGTREEPVYDETETEIMPARMHCYNCGTDNQADTQQCANCQSPLGADSFFPPVSGPVTRQVGTQEVPNGEVKQNLFCGLEVDVDPTAESIRRSPILNLEYEVHLGALREAYPAMFDQIQASATSELSTNGSIDRIARQLIYSQTNVNSSILSDQRPTLSQTWFQKWAFALEDDKEFVERMQTAFPNGCLLINTGPTFLSCQPMDMNKHWTVAKAHEDRYGMYPPSPGDIVVPFQRRYNDMANILHDGIGRTFAGVIVSNNDLIDSKSFQGKPLQFGVFNPVKLKRTGAPGSFKLEDAFHQFEFAIKIAEGMEYQKYNALQAQTFALVPPQVYGGAGDPNIQTAKGQEQNLNTALGAYTIYWENLKDEHAEADELAVKCAAENLTQDLQYSIEDKGAEYRNQFIRLDDLQGSVRAYADVDQGLPVTPQELRQRWMDLWQAAEKNPVSQALFDDPTNQQQFADSVGVPGMVVPGGAMRNKTLAVIELLKKAQAIPEIGPNGQPTGKMNPSVMPDPQVDDPSIAKPVIKEYCQTNFDIENDNPPGWENILAYYGAMTDVETQQAAQIEVTKAKAALAGHMASLPPPPPPPQLSPQEQNMLTQVRQDGAEAMADLLQIAKTPALGQGESLQAQVTAGNALLQLAAKVEQVAADKTSIQ